MALRLKTMPLVGVALLTLALPLCAATAAQATDSTATRILVFSNGDFTDPGEEDADIETELRTLGTVTTFDGGDGSAAAWSTALGSEDVVVFPESYGESGIYGPGGTDAMSDEAAVVVRDWLASGHIALGTGSYSHRGLIEKFTGVDYSDAWGQQESDGGWDLQLSDESLPTNLPNADWAGGQEQYGDWSAEQKAPVTPIYLSADGTNLGVGAFAVGSGAFLYYGYDWYPDSDDVDSGARDLWNEALRLGAAGTLTPGIATPVTSPAPVPVTSPATAPVVAAPVLDLQLQIQPGQPVAGGSVAFSAQGLKEGAAFNLVLRSTPVVLASGTVPAGGTVAQQLTIPAGLEAGWHSVTLTSTYADGTAASSVVWFQIDGSGLLVKTSATAPAPELASTGVEAAPLGIAAFLLLAVGGSLLMVRRRALRRV